MRFLKGKGWLCHGRPLDAQPPDIGFFTGSSIHNNTHLELLVGDAISLLTRQKKSKIALLTIAFFIFNLSFPSFSQINKGEYFFDTDPGVGNGFNLSVSSAADSITINQAVSISGLSSGFHTVYVRTRMSRRWSQAESRGFFITSAASATAGPISQLEY